MPLDLDHLVSTPELGAVPPTRLGSFARSAMFMSHVSGARTAPALGQILGRRDAVRPLHVFLSEACQAWPDPIALNRPCQQRMSYDEMLLVDCTTAAAGGDLATFNGLLADMVGPGPRRSLWLVARRLARAMASGWRT